MKILMMFPYAPQPPPNDLGGTKRNLPFFLQNVRRHEVTVLSFGTRKEEETFRTAYGSLCHDIRFVDRKRPRIINGLEAVWLLLTGRSPFRQAYRRTMQEALDRILREDPVDLIHCCTQMLGFFRFPSSVPVVSDSHEVTYDLLYRIFRETRNPFRKVFAFLTYVLGKRDELRVCRTFDALIATTPRDQKVFAEARANARITVIGNGVDPPFFDEQPASQEIGALVFTGKMSYYPNHQGILFFLDRIFPRIVERMPGAKIYVVGTEPGRELKRRSSPSVIVTGFVEDVRPYIARAQVFVIPLLLGGGIRGKALEAMAMKRPIVTTSIGVEGIELEDEVSALYADAPQEFADDVLRLLEDPAQRTAIADRAYETVKSKYDWDVQGGRLSHLYAEVAAARRRLARA